MLNCVTKSVLPRISYRKKKPNKKFIKERFMSDAAFATKFKDVQTDEQIIALAKAEGYNLEQLSEEELDNVAGGSALGDKIKQAWNWITS